MKARGNATLSQFTVLRIGSNSVYRECLFNAMGEANYNYLLKTSICCR